MMRTDFVVSTVPRDLEVALLCFEVAVDLAPLISKEIVDHDGRLVIARDVVDCWLELPAFARASYGVRRLPTAAGFDGRVPAPELSRFLGAYVDVVDESWVPAGSEPAAIDVDEAECLHRRAWQRH